MSKNDLLIIGSFSRPDGFGLSSQDAAYLLLRIETCPFLMLNEKKDVNINF